MTSIPPTTSTASTTRISPEVFDEVERELAAASASPALAPTVPTDKIDCLANLVLPYVWTTAIGIWVAGLMILQTLIPVVQCIGVGLVTIGVLSSIVFALRSRSNA